jgi:peptide/nickel transport system permease protein
LFLTLIRFKREKLGVAGLVILAFFAIIAVLAPFLATSNPFVTNFKPFLPPSLTHYLGTDNLGRDEFSRLLYGARTSLMVGVSSALLSTLLGILIGAVASYYGGILDYLLMRLTEFFQVTPAFFLAALIVAFFGASESNVIIAIGVTSWAGTARILRSAILPVKQAEYVLAARVSGAGSLRILFSEILPNTIQPVIVNSTLLVGYSILTEAGLSFLGLTNPNIISWGQMISSAFQYVYYGWWLVVFPGVALSSVVLAVNLLGDSINNIIEGV